MHGFCHLKTAKGLEFWSCYVQEQNGDGNWVCGLYYWERLDRSIRGRRKTNTRNLSGKLKQRFFFFNFIFILEDTANGQSKKSWQKSVSSSVFQPSLCMCPETPYITFPHWSGSQDLLSVRIFVMSRLVILVRPNSYLSRPFLHTPSC